MIFSKKAKCILEELNEADEAGTPIILGDVLERWGNGSTWEDLVNNDYVYCLPGAVTVTASGLKYLEG